MFHRLHKIALVALLVATVSASLINEQQETLLLRAKDRSLLSSRNDASLVRPSSSQIKKAREKGKRRKPPSQIKKGGGKSKEDKNQDSGVVVNEGDVVVDKEQVMDDLRKIKKNLQALIDTLKWREKKLYTTSFTFIHQRYN